MKKRIFVSHSSKDKGIIDIFVKNILRLGLNFDSDEIFCTSSEGMGIKSGEDWRKAIKNSIMQAEVILLMISPNYKASEVCLNEMGAAWVTDAKVIPMLMGDILYQKVGVVIEPKQMEKLNNEGLSHLQEGMVEAFPDIQSKFRLSSWESEKRDFLEHFSSYVHKHPFLEIYSQEEMKDKLKELHDLQKKQDRWNEEKRRLLKQIEELKKCKDAQDVEQVNEKYDERDVLEKFEEFVSNVRIALGDVPSIVYTVIYNSRYGKSLNIRGFWEEIEEAKSKKLIDEIDGFYQPSYKKKVMKQIDEALDELSDFLESLDEDETELLEKRYDVVDCSDLEFWTDVLKVNMRYLS